MEPPVFLVRNRGSWQKKSHSHRQRERGGKDSWQKKSNRQRQLMAESAEEAEEAGRGKTIVTALEGQLV